MRLPVVDYGEKPQAVINVAFVGIDGRSTNKPHPIWMGSNIVDNGDFPTFMGGVNNFANALAAIYALTSTANVDVSITFTNPFAVVNQNVGEWGSGDVSEELALSVYLDTDKLATMTIPAPAATLFLATSGPEMNEFDVASATTGLVLPLMEAVAGIPASVADSLWAISDGERVNDTLGYNGVKKGIRRYKKYIPK